MDNLCRDGSMQKEAAARYKIAESMSLISAMLDLSTPPQHSSGPCQKDIISSGTTRA